MSLIELLTSYIFGQTIKIRQFSTNFAEIITQTLIKHGDYLEDDKNHTFINNHGIFQDRSLIELSLVFPHLSNSNRWYSKAINRFMQHAKKDVALVVSISSIVQHITSL